MTDDEDERRVQATAAAKDATEALLKRHFWGKAEVDWPRAAAAIEAGLKYLDLSWGSMTMNMTFWLRRWPAAPTT